MATEHEPAPKRRWSLPRAVGIFLALLVLGTLVSTWVFIQRIYPIQQQLSALKVEADDFRALSPKAIHDRVDPAIGWPELLSGAGGGRVARVQGLVGLKYQVLEGAGGTLFLSPPDATSLDDGPRALLYFAEAAPPPPGSLVEGEVWVSRMDVRGSVSVISPEQLGTLDTSIPAVILIAAAPLTVLAPPRQDLLPEEARGTPAR